jgi:hypothetical protein
MQSTVRAAHLVVILILVAVGKGVHVRVVEERVVAIAPRELLQP